MVRFFFASLAGLLPGVTRREPVALLLGVGLAIVTVWTLAAAVVRLLRFAGREVHLSVENGLITAGESAGLTLSGLRRSSGLWRLTLTSGTRAVTTSGARGARDSLEAIEIGLVPRGLYRGALLQLDLPGLFRLVRAPLEARWEGIELIRAVPRRLEPIGGIAARVRGGTVGVRLRSPERNDELVEQRPYHPGDDPRRLEWRLFAHTGELFVRIGEETPPPTRAATVVIDCTPGRYGHERLDRIVEAGLAVAAGLERDGADAELALETGGDIRLIGDSAHAPWLLAAVDAARGLLEGAYAGRAAAFGVVRGAAARSPAAGASVPPAPGAETAQIRVTDGRSEWVPEGLQTDAVVAMVDGDVRAIAPLD